MTLALYEISQPRKKGLTLSDGHGSLEWRDILYNFEFKFFGGDVLEKVEIRTLRLNDRNRFLPHDWRELEFGWRWLLLAIRGFRLPDTVSFLVLR